MANRVYHLSFAVKTQWQWHINRSRRPNKWTKRARKRSKIDFPKPTGPRFEIGVSRSENFLEKRDAENPGGGTGP
jgi:hypothetical protein